MRTIFLIESRKLKSKIIVVVDALIGAYFSTDGEIGALQFMD